MDDILSHPCVGSSSGNPAKIRVETFTADDETQTRWGVEYG